MMGKMSKRKMVYFKSVRYHLLHLFNSYGTAWLPQPRPGIVQASEVHL